MDDPPLCPSQDLEDTATNPDIPSTTKVSGKPQAMRLLILTPPSTPIIPSHSQQIMGYNQQKHYAPQCLPPVKLTDPDPMTYPMIQMMTHHIQSHKHLMWLIM